MYNKKQSEPQIKRINRITQIPSIINSLVGWAEWKSCPSSKSEESKFRQEKENNRKSTQIIVRAIRESPLLSHKFMTENLKPLFFNKLDYATRSFATRTDRFHAPRNHFHARTECIHGATNHFHAPRNHFHAPTKCIHGATNHFHAPRNHFHGRVCGRFLRENGRGVNGNGRVIKKTLKRRKNDFQK